MKHLTYGIIRKKEENILGKQSQKRKSLQKDYRETVIVKTCTNNKDWSRPQTSTVLEGYVEGRYQWYRQARIELHRTPEEGTGLYS